MEFYVVRLLYFGFDHETFEKCYSLLYVMDNITILFVIDKILLVKN